MKNKPLQTRITMYEPNPISRSRRTWSSLPVKASDRMTKIVIAACTGIQNRCRGTPVPGWMMAKEAGGDLLHIGVRTMCSYSPPPMAPAMKKHSSIRDDAASVMLMDPLADAPQGSARDEASGAATRAGFGSAAEEKQHHQDGD